MNNNKEKEKKWLWMMDYCYKKRISPAQKWAWGLAEKKYNKYKSIDNEYII